VEWIQLAQDRGWWQACKYGDEGVGSGAMELVILTFSKFIKVLTSKPCHRL
jgi:hypothetical protein